MYPKLGVREAGNKTRQWVQTKKSLNKSLLSLTKGPGRVASEVSKLLNNIGFTPAKQFRKHCGPIPTNISKGQVGSLDFQPHKAVTTCSQPPVHHPRWCQRNLSREPRPSFLLHHKEPSPPCCQWRPCEETRFLSPLAVTREWKYCKKRKKISGFK